MGRFRVSRRVGPLCSAACLLLLTGTAQPAERLVAYRGARLHVGDGTVFDPGVLLIDGDKIRQVGPAGDVTVPPAATVRDLSGRVVIPGLVDSHSHVGVIRRPIVDGNVDGNELTGPIQSEIRALDAIDPADPGIKMATAGGITVANIMPGSGNVIGGQTLTVKLRGRTVDEMRFRSGRQIAGLKMANGFNPKSVYGGRSQAPSTRMKIAAMARTSFLKARQYQEKWRGYREKLARGDDADPPAVDLALEPLVEVLERRRIVHHHTHRADDILTVLRLKEEFGFDLVIQHGTEAFLVADRIAAAGVPVSMTVVDSLGGKLEVVRLSDRCGAELAKAGVSVLINTDDPVTESRFLLRTAAITVGGGLDRDLALQAVTLRAAEALRIDDRVGSLEKGKDADFVVLDGEPFSIFTRVLETYIDAERVFDRADPRLARYQTGGFAVAERDLVPEAAPKSDPPPGAPEPPEMGLDAAAPNSSSAKIAILAGRVHTVSDGTFDRGVILVEDGKVRAVGPSDRVAIPREFTVLRAAEVTPGLIDANASVPLSGAINIPADQEVFEKGGPTQPELRVLDAFHPREPLLRWLLTQGVTLVHTCPGPGNLIAGQSGVFRTHGGSADEMAVRFPQALVGNLGEGPKSASGKPSTRMGVAAMLRSSLAGAADYARTQADAGEKDGTADRDLGKEALAEAVSGRLPVFIRAHRSDDLLTGIRVAEEFDLKTVLGLATEGYLIADRLAEAGVPVVVHPTMQTVGGLETINTHLGNAARLAEEGIPIAIGSGYEAYVPKTRVVRYEAGVAMAHGLGPARALEAITLGAAKILGIDDRFGSIEVGKSADLVLFDGHPLETTTHALHVVVAGRLAYSRSDQEAIPFARRFLPFGVEPACCLFR